MDDLLNVAKGVMENFDPAKDSVDTYEEIKDGEYNCLLEDVKHQVSKETGNNWIGFKFSIQDEGEYKGRYLFVNYFFTQKTTERSIKALTKLAYEFGYQLPLDSFSDFDTLADTLNGMAGNQALVKKSTSKNDFVNYKVTPLPF